MFQILEILLYMFNIYYIGFSSLYILIISIDSMITGINLLYLSYNLNNICYINEEYNNFISNQYIYKFIQCISELITVYNFC